MRTFMKRDIQLAALIALAGISSVSFAQDDYLTNQTEEILNSDQIDIDGTFKKESAADRVAKMRKKLEQQNEQMVQKKIEDIRIKQEEELANKLKSAFQGNLKAMDQDGASDSLDTVQAAPQRVVAPMPEFEDQEEEKIYQVIPYAGGKVFNSDKIDNFSSNADAGITLETMLNERLSLGFRFGYTTMDFTDKNTYLSNVNSYNYQNLNVKYKNMAVGIQSKFFFTTSRFRPYVALGANYNRTTLDLDNSVNNNNGCYNYGYGYQCNNNTDTKTASGSNFTGTASVGGQFQFTKTIGLNIQFDYSRALTDAFNSSNLSTSGNQQVSNYLKQQGSNLDKADIAALNLGLVVKF